MKKKIIAAVVIVFMVSGFVDFAFGDSLVQLRSEVSSEGARIKRDFKGSQDIIFLSSMWDACMITGVQLDAYFSMVGVVGTIKEAELTAVSVEYLIEWLNRIKENDLICIKNLTGLTDAEPKTKNHIKRLTKYYEKLNTQIDMELKGLEALAATLPE